MFPRGSGASLNSTHAATKAGPQSMCTSLRVSFWRASRGELVQAWGVPATRHAHTLCAIPHEACLVRPTQSETISRKRVRTNRTLSSMFLTASCSAPLTTASAPTSENSAAPTSCVACERSKAASCGSEARAEHCRLGLLVRTELRPLESSTAPLL